jgi:hypothetical protein
MFNTIIQGKVEGSGAKNFSKSFSISELFTIILPAILYGV